MDLPRFFRVLWRFKWIVAVGTVGAAALAFLSVARVDTSGRVTHRQTEEWVSYARIFVTQEGFPWGRLYTGPARPDSADTARLTTLAIIYAQLADSDPVRQLMLQDGPIVGKVETAALPVSPNSNEALPIVSIAAFGETERESIDRASRQANALVAYVAQQQDADRVPDRERAVLEVIKEPQAATLVNGRSYTLPVVVFLAVMLAVVGLAFLLENLRPRPQRDPSDEALASAAPRPDAPPAGPAPPAPRGDLPVVLAVEPSARISHLRAEVEPGSRQQSA